MKKTDDLTPLESQSSPDSISAPIDEQQLESIRSILFAGDRQQIEALAAETAALEKKSEKEKEVLLLQIEKLQQELDALQELNRLGQERAKLLQDELNHIRQDMVADYENRMPFLVDRISEILSQAATESRNSLSRALGPIMGPAISLRIRESSDEMIDALQPIILRTVQKAIADFARDLQRNIDARLKATVGPISFIRTFPSRLRGVNKGDLILRESLPFTIHELFLIQRESGLLIDYAGVEHEDVGEKELIGGMLTAIRDFTRDSFGDVSSDEELEEIQYGDERIIIEGGTAAYIAAAIRGVEPPGFRAALRDFITHQHLYYGDELHQYSGDPDTVPDFKEKLNKFRDQFIDVGDPPPKPMSSREKRVLMAGGIGAVLLLMLACFYLQFTIALLPVAFGETATPTSTMLPSATVISPDTVIPSASPTAANTNTPAPTLTPATTPPPSATPSSFPSSQTGDRARTLELVWAFQEPDMKSDRLFTIPTSAGITILDIRDGWLEVELETASGELRGWIPLQWIELP